MRTDAAIKQEGMNALLCSLNLVEAERFITLIKRAEFDYTDWRTTLWKGKASNPLLRRQWSIWRILSILLDNINGHSICFLYQ